MEETTTQTETTTVEKKELRPAIDRVNDTLGSIRNFFAAQEKMYDKNPVRIAIVKDVIKRLQSVSVTEEEAEAIVIASKEGDKQRTNKWTNDVLKYANAKSYAISTLKDKAEDLNPGVPKLSYELIMTKIREWNVMPVASPCPWHTCRTNELIKTEQRGDGLWYTACYGKHPKIETTEGASTAALSVDMWNEICQG